MSGQESEICIISIVEGDDPSSRIVFAVDSDAEEKPILFRQESFSEGVGWFVQNQIAMTRQEMIQFRSALGAKMHRACERTAKRISNDEEHPVLRIYQAS